MRRFEVRDAVHRDVVQFLSDAPLGRTIGTNQWIKGWVEVDLSNLKKATRGEFEVDMRGFDTGIQLRNHHLRDSFLTTQKFPYAKFTLDKVEHVSKNQLTVGQPVVAELSGTLHFRDVSQKMRVKAKLIYFKEDTETKKRLPGNLLRVSADFTMDLKTHGVPWEDSLKMHIAQFVKVSVDVVGTDGSLPFLYSNRPDDQRQPDSKVE